MNGFGLVDTKLDNKTNKPPLAVIKDDILSGDNFTKYANFIGKVFISKFEITKEDGEWGSSSPDLPDYAAGTKIVEMLSNFNKIKIFSDRLAQQMYQATDEYNEHIEQTKQLLSQVRKYSGTLIQYQSHFNGLAVDSGSNKEFYKMLASNFGEFSESLMMVGDSLGGQLRELIKAKREKRTDLVKRLSLNRSLIITDNKTDQTILNAAKEIAKLKKVIQNVPEDAKKLTGKAVLDRDNDINLNRPRPR